MRQLLVLAALAAPALSAQQFSSGRHIPHIAQGSGWSTELHVFNTCRSTVRYRIFLLGSSGGSQMFIPQGTGDVAWGPAPANHIAAINGQPITNQTHVWLFPDTGTDLRQGYGKIFDDSGGRSGNSATDGGCVVADVVNKQHLTNGEIRSATVPLQRLPKKGSVLRFDNSDDCRTGVAIIREGSSDVWLEAFRSSGDKVFFRVRLAPEVRHLSFMLDEWLPVPQGTLHIGGEAGVMGLDFCGGKLVQFRLPHPVP